MSHSLFWPITTARPKTTRTKDKYRQTHSTQSVARLRIRFEVKAWRLVYGQKDRKKNNKIMVYIEISWKWAQAARACRCSGKTIIIIDSIVCWFDRSECDRAHTLTHTPYRNRIVSLLISVLHWFQTISTSFVHSAAGCRSRSIYRSFVFEFWRCPHAHIGCRIHNFAGRMATASDHSFTRSHCLPRRLSQ